VWSDALKNLLIYGGSFDPPHLGHLNTAIHVQEHFHFQSIVFLPCKKSVLKNQIHVDAAFRITMLKLMLNKQPEFSISTREIDRDSPSYMVETLNTYREELGLNYSITLLLGMDAFLSLPRWHQWESILKLSNLLVLKRNETTKQEISNELKLLLRHQQCSKPLELKTNPHGKIVFFDAGDYPISSTEIRRKIQKNEDVRDDLSSDVYNFIKKFHLYTQNT